MKLNEFKKAKEALDNSQVISFPTETVMGLGVYFNDYSAYCLLNRIKCRPEDKPYTMMLYSVDEIKKYASIDDRAEKVIESFMPGEITILLPSKDVVPTYVTHNTGVIGLRVPNLPELLEFLEYIKTPLLVPSANKSGDKPALNSDEVRNIFKEELGYIFEGHSGNGVPSTIVDLTGKEVKIYREGSIKKEDIINCIEKE